MTARTLARTQGLTDGGVACHKPEASLVWLDALKGIAILAVVFDHAYIIDDYLVWKHAYFAVSWFIFLAGVSNAFSSRQRTFGSVRAVAGFWAKRSRALLGPYIWVSIVTYVALDISRFSPQELLHRLLLANSQPQLYFVPLLLQLLIVFPLLFHAIYRSTFSIRLIAVSASLLATPFLTRSVGFPWALGAHYLLGGSFLYLFLAGMLATPLLVAPGRRLWALLLICLTLLVVGEHELQRTGGTMMTHPPSTPMLVYTLGLLGVAYAVCQLLPSAPLVRLLARLGRRSLDIFLYHYIFLLPFLSFRDPERARRLPFPHAQWVIVAVAIPSAVAGSLLASQLSGLLRLWLVQTVQRFAAWRAARPARRTVVAAPSQSR